MKRIFLAFFLLIGFLGAQNATSITSTGVFSRWFHFRTKKQTEQKESPADSTRIQTDSIAPSGRGEAIAVDSLTGQADTLVSREGDLENDAHALLTGAERTDLYLPLLSGKRVGLVVNQTAVIRRPADSAYVPLPDSLLAIGIDVRCIMAPEHGYKGMAEAGAHIRDSRDETTGLSIYSLYGNDKKPRTEWMKGIDVLVFDIQDVGCRFYTYLSTLYYVMQACAEQHKELVILDRPNPNDVVDGPTLKAGYESFVGIVRIPLMHGCTLGEMAVIMDAMHWTAAKRQPGQAQPSLTLHVIPCDGWQHGQPYSLPIGPSKNLQNDHAIALYPSLCLFEGSEVSVGRGTDHPFEMFGIHDLRQVEAPRGFSLRFYQQYQQEKGWGWITRVKFFNMLAGSNELYEQLKAGKTEEEIRQTWQDELQQWNETRRHYALYTITE